MSNQFMRQSLSRREFLKIAAIGSSSLAIAAITGCAPAAKPNNPTQPAAAPTTAAPASEAASLAYWTIWSDGPQSEYLKVALARFNVNNPDIKVTTTFISGDDSDYNPKINAAIAGGKPPDVLDTSGSPRFGFRKMLVDLDPLLAASTVVKKEDFIPGQIIRDSWGGKLYAIPREADCNAIFWWNKDIFKEVGLDPETPPKTWDELLTFSEKTQKKDSSGRFSRQGFSPTYGQSWFYVYLWQTGGELYTPYPPSESSEPKVSFNDDKGALALDFMVKLADLGGGEQSMSAFENGFQGGVQQPFFTGQLAMMCTGDWNFADQITYAPKLNFGVAAMPIPSTPTAKVTTSSGGWAYSIPVGGKVDPAWKMIEHMSGESEQAFRVDALTKLPGNMKVLNSPKLQNDPLLKVAADLLKVAHGFPEQPWVSDMWNIVNTKMRDEALYKQKTVQQALDDAAVQVQAAVHKIYAPA